MASPRRFRAPASGVSCLVLDPEGALVAHGVAQCTAEEAMAMQKGIAVRVRGGLQPSS